MTITKMTRSAHGLDGLGDGWATGALCSPATAHQFDVIATRTDRPSLTVENRQAIALCRRCPVDKQACLDNALSNNHPHLWVIAAGQLVYNGRVVDIPPPQARPNPRDPGLPKRIADLRRQDHTQAAIAAMLHVSVGTVRRYLQRTGHS